MFFRRMRELEKRVENLERAQKVASWSFGFVDLQRLTQIVEQLDRSQRAANTYTSAAQQISRDT